MRYDTKMDICILQREKDIFSFPIVVVDLETTGLDPDKDRIIEVALLRYNLDGSIQEWSSLVHPQRNIPSKTIAIHHITDNMVQHAPLFENLAKRIRDDMEGCIFVGHNVEFDFQFLQKAYAKTQFDMPNIVAKIDTLAISRRIYNFPRNDLQSLIVRFGLHAKVAHRASHDAYNTYQIFRMMMQNLPSEESNPTTSIQNIENLFDVYARNSDKRTEHTSILQNAIENQLIVIIEYTSSHPDRPLVQYRRIRPQKMDHKWIHGHCFLRDAERSFMLRRIRDVLYEEPQQEIHSS